EVAARGSRPAIVTPTLDADSILDILAAMRAGGAVLMGPKWPAAVVRDRSKALPRERLAGTVIFTSGSSGPPKGVHLLESNWEAAGTNSSAFFGFGPGKLWLLCLPLHHVSGLSIVFRALCSGGAVLISPDLRGLARADLVSLVPTQLSRLSDPGKAQALVIGGGALPAALADRVEAWPVVRTYGMTETAAVAASARLSDGLGHLYPLPGLEFRVTEGLLEVRGAQVSPGYAGEIRSAPWFTTADRGALRSDGSIEIHGRADRVINSGGEKIDASAVEHALATVGAGEVAVVGLADPEWGEIVAAAYTADCGSEELARAVRDSLGPEAVPRRLLRVPALPTTDLGKVDYSALVGFFTRQEPPHPP
ncbi:MAG TPA: AMP-binding protein, partial [Acidimicrobiia bacterium]|nr:AMP-binding protein [Acidimicrobiia bacterium]